MSRRLCSRRNARNSWRIVTHHNALAANGGAKRGRHRQPDIGTLISGAALSANIDSR